MCYFAVATVVRCSVCNVVLSVCLQKTFVLKERKRIVYVMYQTMHNNRSGTYYVMYVCNS